MKRTFITVFVSLFAGITSFISVSHAELTPISDAGLQSFHGQFNARSQKRSDTKVVAKSDSELALSPSLLGLDASDLNLTQGIELDLSIQTSFDFEYIDNDGIGESFNGEAGSLIFSGVNIGSSQTPITPDRVQSEAPFTENELALVNNILIDVDSSQGMFITIEELGDHQGNGIDVVIRDTYLGNKDISAGSFLIEDVSNFIQDSQLARHNQLFGSQLSTLDDGKNTQEGNWVPFFTKVRPTGQDPVLDSTINDPIQNLPSDDLGFPALSANTIIDASFVLNIDKIAWIDDGNGFGLAGVMVYQGIDTDNDGIDDLVGPARLTEMKLETVDHKALDGTDVKALYIENLDFKADIAIQSIYVGSPEHSLGALHIKGLDTSGTSLWIYPH